MSAPRASRLRAFTARLRGFVRGPRHDEGFDEEMQEHLRLLAERFMAQGTPRVEAMAAARRQFGNTTLLQEDRRALQTLPTIEVLWRDLRYAVRTLRKSPGFAGATVLVLALGIASNTAIFSVVHATFLAPLPYHDPDRLVMVWSNNQGNRNATAAADFFEWRRRSGAFSDLHVTGMQMVNLAGGDRPEQMRAQVATPGLPAMMCAGHPLAKGRLFLDEEGTPGKDQVVILSHNLWQERFAGDPNVLGQAIRIDGKPFTVVGVLGKAPCDHLPWRLWIPRAFSPDQINRDFHNLLVMGRLKPGVSIEQANADMKNVTDALAREFPESNTGWGARVEPLRNNFMNAGTRTSLWMMLGAVGFVLLIACANVANLLLARGTARQHELAIRGALGASRRAIVRQLLTESVLLALIGGALGVGLAAAAMRAILAVMPPFLLPSEVDVRLSLPVLLFTLTACVLSGVLFGLAPAWQAVRADVNAALKETGRSVGDGRNLLRRTLVVAEFALALTLLTGGGLTIQSLINIARTDLGFRSDGVFTFYLPVENERLKDAGAIDAFYRQFAERVSAVPSVTSVSYSSGMPAGGAWNAVPFTIAGRAGGERSQRPSARFNQVSPAYFETLGIRIVRGRAFTEADRAGMAPVAIVNETFVKRHFPDVDPLTQRVVIEQFNPGVTNLGPGIEWQIVGVSADVRNLGPASESLPEIHVPFAQSTWARNWMAVRTASDPLALHQPIAAVVRSIDPDLPMVEVRTMDQLVTDSTSRARFTTILFGAFAFVALVLAALGIYGVMAFAVAQRTHEIGLRIALGAGRARVVRRVLRDGMGTALLGTLIGSAGAYFVARGMRGMVPGVGPGDPTAFIVVAATLIGAALVACLLPASRAASVDPMTALRQE
jgi:putative ABC transport system permease protein